MVKKLILCEGGDDIALFNKYITEISKVEKNLFEIRKMSSKSNFFKIENYSSISQQIKANLFDKVLFILDSDFEENDNVFGGYINTEKEIKKIIKELNIESLADYFISCEPSTRSGNLEHLLLSTCEDNKRNCIEGFIKCIHNMDIENSNKKIVVTAYKEIFKDYPYNFQHENFNEFKLKISKLFE